MVWFVMTTLLYACFFLYRFQVMGTALLTGSIAAITDSHNAGTPKALVPLVFTPMLYGVVMTFGVNTGAAINTALDLSGRLFAAIIYGSEVFRYRNLSRQ